MKKKLKWAGIGLLALLVVIQFFPPDRTNPPVDPSATVQAHLDVPPNVDAIFKRSCYDCHSNESVWPWYSHVAPVSWIVAGDVHDARHFMNLSEWAKYKPGRVASLLEQICDETSGGDMPLKSYAFMHPQAKLSPDDIDALCAWTDSLSAKMLRP